MILEESAVTAKTKELCATIVEQESFVKLQSQVEAFLNNDEARLQYQSVHESGDALNQKQRSGVELSDSEITEFEQAREQLLQNSVVTDFMSAQKELQEIQNTVGKMVSLTLELGRVPTADDIETASSGGGCCGGGGGGGCGC
ncbi:MAG: YlbF family regulator [Akkermansiaceae bacterium]